MTVEDLMMSLALPSANDAAVCLGEYLCGSEEAFVERDEPTGLRNWGWKTPTSSTLTAWTRKDITLPPMMWL